jgi:tetratricopeptide (TPR) repeat protein
VVAVLTAVTPCLAAVDRDPNADRYFAARLAEFEDRDADALANYIVMFKADATSPALAERLYQNAMLQGDIPSAIKAVRALELHNSADATAPLLLFADAFKRRDWQNAGIAIAELEAKSNFGFIAPVLRGWVNVAQGKPHGFNSIAARSNPMLGYYSSDQAIYLEMASGNLKSAKPLLLNFRNAENDFARDLIIRAVPAYAANNEADFARALLSNTVEQEFSDALLNPNQKGKAKLQPMEGLAALFSRFSSALNEQNVPEQALITARIAYWLDAQSEPSKLALSKALYAVNRRKPAFEMLRKISPSSPYSAQAVSEEIRKLLSEDRGQDALTLAQAEIRRYPNSSRAITQLAQAYEQQGNQAQAVQVYHSLVSLAEKENAPPRRQALNLLYLATATDKSGNWRQARTLLDKANRLDPNNPYILNYLGFTLLERREDIPTALELVKRAYQIAPDSAAIADSLGWGHFLNGDYKQSITFLEQAVKQAANDVTINEHLGDAYWQYGKRVDARYAWMTAAHKASESDKLRLQKKIDFGLIFVNPDVALLK